MPERQKINVVVVDWHTTRQLPNYYVDDKLCRIFLTGRYQNYYQRINEIEEFIGKKIHPLIYDLYKIALSVYVSDLQFKRDIKIPNRKIKILLSVSSKEKWDMFKEKLEGVLYSLSGDSILFEFVQGKQSNNEFNYEFKNDNKVVSLFSGGIDSLTGVKYLLDKEKEPILISHASPAKVISIQNKLIDELNTHFPNKIEHLSINAVSKGKTLKNQEDSRRLRSFLFLVLGSIITLEKGINELYIFENGIMSLNLPISNSRIFLNTKTTHPTYIHLLNQFINEFYHVSISIKNPFLFMTKTEVLSLNDSFFISLIKNTISCARITPLIMHKIPIGRIWHCGTCLPCILRRISIDASGFISHDAHYAQDILNFESLSLSDRNLVLEMMTFSKDFLSYTNNEDILINYPSLFIEEFDPSDFIKLYQRYSKELIQFFNKQ